jgi:hypothetical protein
MQRIIYVSWPAREITGGIKMAFRHVEALRQAGYTAYIATPDGHAPGWFATPAPVLSLADLVPTTDVLVLPENHKEMLERFAVWGARKLVFCQNQFQIQRGLGGRLDYAELGIHDLICPSQQAAAFCRRRFPAQNLWLIPSFIDRNLFHPRGPRKVQIAYAPRKRQQEAAIVQDLFRAENPAFRALPWVPLAGLPEKEIAQLLGESTLYLSLARFESFGLSALEAMASGCLVAGFTGLGGRDYATAQNGFWAIEDDCLDCVDQLTQAVRLMVEGGEQYRAMVEAAQGAAEYYNHARFQRRLLECWRAIAPDACPSSQGAVA